MRVLLVGAAMVAAAGFGLSGKGGSPDVPMAIPAAAPGASAKAARPMKENVVAVHTSDSAMAAARRKARATLPRFVKLMEAGTPGTYTVKFPLTQNGATEHLWMQLTGHDEAGFTGRLANDPVNGRKYRMGDRLTVAKADVEDWMINGGDAMYGGYTARVMLDTLPAEKAAKLRPLFRD